MTVHELRAALVMLEMFEVDPGEDLWGRCEARTGVGISPILNCTAPFLRLASKP